MRTTHYSLYFFPYVARNEPLPKTRQMQRTCSTEALKSGVKNPFSILVEGRVVSRRGEMAKLLEISGHATEGGTLCGAAGTNHAPAGLQGRRRGPGSSRHVALRLRCRLPSQPSGGWGLQKPAALAAALSCPQLQGPRQVVFRAWAQPHFRGQTGERGRAQPSLEATSSSPADHRHLQACGFQSLSCLWRAVCGHPCCAKRRLSSRAKAQPSGPAASGPSAPVRRPCLRFIHVANCGCPRRPPHYQKPNKRRKSPAVILGPLTAFPFTETHRQCLPLAVSAPNKRSYAALRREWPQPT